MKKLLILSVTLEELNYETELSYWFWFENEPKSLDIKKSFQRKNRNSWEKNSKKNKNKKTINTATGVLNHGDQTNEERKRCFKTHSH